MKRKKKLDCNLNKELFDTTKYVRIFELSPIWFKLLSNLENNFLRELLEDVKYIEGIESEPVNVIDNKPLKLEINFKTNSSYNLFKLSMTNTESRKIIEKIFKKTFGEEIVLSIKKPN
jgi:hypothetical protein